MLYIDFTQFLPPVGVSPWRQPSGSEDQVLRVSMCVRIGLITPEPHEVWPLLAVKPCRLPLISQPQRRHEADPAMASREAEDNDITNNRPRCGCWLAYDLGLSLVVRYAI